MARNALIFFAAIVTALLLFLWAENQVAPSFQSCISQNPTKQGAENSNDYGKIVAVFVKAQSICSLRLIDRHNGFFAAIAAAIVAAFTFTLSRSTVKLWETGEKQIAVAKEAAEAAMKAARISEIALESAETPYLYPIVRQFSKEDGDGSSPFSYAFENFGRSPAIVREIYDGSIVSRGLPSVIGFPPPQSNLGKSYVVAAGKCSPWRNMGIPIVGDTNAAAWLIGQVRYSDVFGNQFLSGFCFALNSVSLAFAAYGGAGYNYRRKLTDQERELAETRDADPLVAVAP